MQHWKLLSPMLSNVHQAIPCLQFPLLFLLVIKLTSMEPLMKWPSDLNYHPTARVTTPFMLLSTQLQIRRPTITAFRAELGPRLGSVRICLWLVKDPNNLKVFTLTQWLLERQLHKSQYCFASVVANRIQSHKVIWKNWGQNVIVNYLNIEHHFHFAK